MENDVDMKNQKQKKGCLAMIWESMTKTGGCCGSGENCCGSAQPDNDQQKKVAKQGHKGIIKK